jgi:aminopeptidase-like protein
MTPYMKLMAELAPLDRCHNGPEMEAAYGLLAAAYPGARLLHYPVDREVHHWRLPPRWSCELAELRDDTGALIASRARHPLEVFSFSPPVDRWLSWDELQPHLLTDPERPDALIFHFRNQYRHWAPVWGFSVPHRRWAALDRGRRYHAVIRSAFSTRGDMVQSDYLHRGASEEEYVFLGHFDHPAQVNDGLAGCIAAYEAVRRLQGTPTRYSYRAFASVEIAGAAAYLDRADGPAATAKGALFVGCAGLDAPLVYQETFGGDARIDRIVKFLLQFEGPAEGRVLGHREMIGNDENVFDSVGYEIPTGTLMRLPFPHYHTDADNLANTRESRMEEMIAFVLKIIGVLEHDRPLKAAYRGIPSLANPDIDLYLSLDSISGLKGAAGAEIARFGSVLGPAEIAYLHAHPDQPGKLMQNILRMADGRRTLLDVAEKSRVPFPLALDYALRLQAKGLVTLL